MSYPMWSTIASAPNSRWLAPRTAKCAQCECHHCDNRRCQMPHRWKRGVKLKSDLSPCAVQATKSQPQMSTTTPDAAILLAGRLDSGDALQSAAPMSRSNHTAIASDHQVCGGRNALPSPPAASACFSIVNRSRTHKWPSPSMAHRSSRIACWHLFTLLSLCLCLSVISSSRYQAPESNPPPYSQYYPPYMFDSPSQSQTSRTGKSRTLAKSPEVLPNAVQRQFLESSFSGGEISGIQVLRKSQLGNDQLVDYRITSDVIIPDKARLEIEPGVRIVFSARVGITVRGTLLANVSECECKSKA